jgi:hypothetical protein
MCQTLKESWVAEGFSVMVIILGLQAKDRKKPSSSSSFSFILISLFATILISSSFLSLFSSDDKREMYHPGARVCESNLT